MDDRDLLKSLYPESAGIEYHKDVAGRCAMPTVMRIGRFRFFFFSNENNEPCHIHVEYGDAYAKFWLVPEVRLASSQEMSAKDLAEASKLARENKTKLVEAWDEYFKS